MKRSKFSLSNYRLLTAQMGKLVPVSCFEVLPGDSMRIGTSALIRFSPLVAPVMHPVQVRFHTWFVPNRLVWNGWEDFITGGKDGNGADTPYPELSLSSVTKSSLANYLGVPADTYNSLKVSALPFYAYNLIFNEFYRDEDLLPEVALDSQVLQNCAWEKDYFTSSRPWPQKGPEVTLPLGNDAPIRWEQTGAAGVADGKFAVAGVSTGAQFANYGDTYGTMTGTAPDGNYNMVADLKLASAVAVNDVRKAFALQRYQEARARYGSRYTEYLRYLGINPSDARLQRPEYIGGGKQTVSFSEVLATADTQDVPVGAMKGHGISAMRSRRAIKFFEEHGHVITLMSVRPKTIYGQALNRMWSRRDKEDYWQAELQHIGQQEVMAKEVYAKADESVLGYQDRYDEYRRLPSTICGDFEDTLNYWHLARQFANQPALNQSFVECNPSNRIFAEQTSDHLWIMVNNNIQARRLVSGSAAPRIY